MRKAAHVLTRFLDALPMRRRIVRVLISLLLLAGFILLQYYLANIPLPVEVEKSAPLYAPISAQLIKKEEIVIVKPSRMVRPNESVPANVLFFHEGHDFLTVDAHFDSARLGDDVIDRLRRDPQKRPFPSNDLQQVTYTTAGDEDPQENSDQIQQTDPCRTSIYVGLAQNATMPAEIHFLQSDAPGAKHHRYFEMRVVGSDVVVQLLTRNSAPNLGKLQGPGCSKILSVGNNDWVSTFSSPLAQSIHVRDGSKIRFSFTALNDETAEPVGTSLEVFRLESCPLSAHEIHKIEQGVSSTAALFSARSIEGENPLTLKQLLVGSDNMQLDFTGKVMIQEKGKYVVTFDLLEFAKRNTLLTAVLAMLDLALLEWLRRFAFGYRVKRAAGFR